MKLFRLHSKNEHWGEILSEDIPPLSIDILSEECINCGALAEHSRAKHSCCQYGKAELASVNYPEALKIFLLGSHSDV